MLNLVPGLEERAKGVIRGLTGDAFNSGQIDTIFDQVVKNISEEGANKFRAIDTGSSPIVLSQEQYRIVNEQLNALDPEFRESAVAAFKRALTEGRILLAP